MDMSTSCVQSVWLTTHLVFIGRGCVKHTRNLTPASCAPTLNLHRTDLQIYTKKNKDDSAEQDEHKHVATMYSYKHIEKDVCIKK